MSKLIPANKNAKYQIKEGEESFYHLKVVEATPTKDNRPITEEKIIILSEKDFKGYLKFKTLFSWVSEEIIHDPTIHTEQEEEPTGDGEPPKKKVNAGLAAYHAKQKEIKQSKPEEQ